MPTPPGELAPYRERVLFIDDSRSQLQLYRDQLDHTYDVSCASTYEEAMALLSSHQPDLVILDMVMPQVDGLEFLDILKSTHSFSQIPVIMVSAENDPQIVRNAFLKGAADFVRKPYDAEELQLRVRRILKMPQRVHSPKETEVLQFFSARSLMIKALADLAGSRDNDTGFHLNRIEKYTATLALAVARKGRYQDQITGNFLESVGEISVLHDIGKVGIPDSILKKPGRLTPEEFQTMQTHTTIGAETIQRVQERFPDYGFLAMAHDIALYHHEKWNGKGYPTGISGEAIPLSARLVGIVDVFDALTSQRVYKPAMTIEETMEVMQKDRGSHFDPDLFDIFVECMPMFRTIMDHLSESAN